ncbi:MAG TPA: tripartite tricarboxylate transporter substrate-binding protein [Reyranella sp.]|nr:tripartite tricarboxylate transporter substrate-binding protein [Reyranella sp.]
MSDLLAVTQVNSAPLKRVLHPSVPANSAAELIALAKARPGKLNYGSGGVFMRIEHERWARIIRERGIKPEQSARVTPRRR